MNYNQVYGRIKLFPSCVLKAIRLFYGLHGNIWKRGFGLRKERKSKQIIFYVDLPLLNTGGFVFGREGTNMKKLQWVFGILLSLSVVVILLITSFQAAMYADFGFYQKEYEKYGVLSELDMNMEDVMYVTHEMMAYLKGDREALEVITTVEGKEQDFFNEQDRLHMADVQALFLGGLKLRVGAFVVLLICLLALAACRMDWKYVIPRAFQAAVALTAVAGVLLAFAFSRDFTAAFTKFHEIFFTNDLWIFDPAQDYMIRMLPEGLFADMVARIGAIFGVLLAVLLAVSVVWRRKTNIKKTNE